MTPYSKRKRLLGIVCMLCFSFATKAQKAPEYIFPQSFFNEEETAKMLDEGTNSIQGKISLKKKKTVYYPSAFDKVLLYPVTPYLLEYLELQKKYNSAKKQAAMGREAFIYRIEAKYRDEQGSFVFDNIKPGKYYVLTWITYKKTKSYEYWSGRVYNTYNVYGQAIGLGYSEPSETRYYTYDIESEVGGFIEVTGNGQVVNVNLTR